MGKELIMDYHQTIDKLVTVMRKERVVFFVASGISMPEPTQAPSGMKLRDDIVNTFTSTIAKSMPHLSDSLLNRVSRGTDESPPLGFEEVCQVVSHGTQDYEGFVGCLDRLLNGSTEAPREPNLIHYFLARCLKSRHVVVTPNYDSIIEEAWSRQLGFDEELEIYYDENGFRQFMENLKCGTRRAVLLKVHGTFRAYKFSRGCAQPERVQEYESVITTLERVGKGLPQVLASVLRELIQEYSMVFMGYSASDIDIIYPIFAKALDEQPSEKLIFWLRWDPENPCSVLGKDDLVKIRRQQQKQPLLSRDWEIFNVSTLLDNRNQQGAEERAWRIDANSEHFVRTVASSLGWDLYKHREATSQYRNSQAVLDKWATEKEEYQRLLVLASLAGRVGLWDKQYQLCDKVLRMPNIPQPLQLVAHRMAAWATRKINRRKSLKHSAIALQLARQVEWPEDVFMSIEISYLHSLRALSYLMTGEMMRTRYEIYRALHKRPCYEASTIWAFNHAQAMMEWKTALVQAARRHLVEDPRDEVAEILNRVAGVLYTFVRDPCVESTPLGPLTDAERARLEVAIEFARYALHITEETGNVRYRAQVLNRLGPALAKLGTQASVDEAKDLYETSKRIAGQLGWTRESAQHPRQMGIVYEAVAEVQRERDKRMKWFQRAIEMHEEAIRNWDAYGDPKGVAGDIQTARWHLGRILIKKEQYKDAAARLKEVISMGGEWQVQANAKAFLLVALTRGGKEMGDREEIEEETERVCMEICFIYGEQLRSAKRFKATPYAYSNALANLYTVQDAARKESPLESRASRLRSRVCQICESDSWLAELAPLGRRAIH